MPYHLFEVFGVELEYMIVDRTTLAVRPLADTLLRDVAGAYVSEVENGPVTWSNELVNHVIELKVSTPVSSLAGLAERFHHDVRRINERLEERQAMLLPTGAHPLMDPYTETQLWPHENKEIYALYDRIFDCRGHGWANLQSTHINLPFADDAEFERLHAAVRVLLPILPALSASTPLLDGHTTGFADTRLETYRHNQERIPSIAGVVIPEPVFSQADYQARIFDRINADVRPYDTGHILDQHFLNSRGAIARFDRGAIEIRILDIQECPAADVALLAGLVAVLQALVDERWTPRCEQKSWSEHDLAALFLDVIRHGEQTLLTDPAYLLLFGMDAAPMTAGALWRHLYNQVQAELPEAEAHVLDRIITHGTLSTRILHALGNDITPAHIRTTYRRLADCLATNTLFV